MFEGKKRRRRDIFDDEISDDMLEDTIAALMEIKNLD